MRQRREKREAQRRRMPGAGEIVFGTYVLSTEHGRRGYSSTYIVMKKDDFTLYRPIIDGKVFPENNSNGIWRSPISYCEESPLL